MRVTRAVLPLLGFAAERGVSPPSLLQSAGLDPSLFAGPDVDLPHAQELRLWSEGARLTGDADFGLHLAEWLAPRSAEAFDILAFALRSCATLGDHYRRASHYMRLVHAGIFLALEEEADTARLVHGHHREPRDPPRHPVEGHLALALLVGRQAIGEDFAPLAVRFVHGKPAGVTEHERIFRAPVEFGAARNELVLDRALLLRPQRQAEPQLLALLSRQLDGILAIQPAEPRFQHRVQQSMMEELPDQEPSVPVIAARLRMSPRTLQRRLQSEGATFAGVLADMRRDLALRYLRDQRIAICEVGFLLGFQDVTSFHRAFKRWTGRTPAEYRRDGFPRHP